jgi:hypothetical protein
MGIEQVDAEPVRPARPLLDRRTLLLGAAWTVPAIQVAAAAPAFAATSDPALSLSVVGPAWSSTAISATFTLQVTITNTGGLAVTQPRVTLTFPTRWNPTTTTPAGWTVTGSRTRTVVYTLAAGTLPPASSAGFTVTLNPADAVVGAGSYVADGGGLAITATGTNATPGSAVLDLAGAYPNLVVAGGTAQWTRNGTIYTIPFSTTVTNRGRTATNDLQVTHSENFSGTLTNDGTPSAGWTWNGTRFDAVTQLGPGAQVTLAATMRSSRNWNGSAPAGTLTLTPRDNAFTGERATVGRITVPARSTW